MPIGKRDPTQLLVSMYPVKKRLWGTVNGSVVTRQHLCRRAVAVQGQVSGEGVNVKDWQVSGHIAESQLFPLSQARQIRRRSPVPSSTSPMSLIGQPAWSVAH